MNGPLFWHTWRSQRLKLAFVSLALAVWGFLMPVVYGRYGSQFRAIVESGMLPDEVARFGGGDIFSLAGSIALGFIHPIPISLIAVFAVGFSATAVAGERQRGTLEVALARPLSRRMFYVTLLVATLSFVAVAVTALLAGTVGGSFFAGVNGELAFEHLPFLWLNGVLLFGTFATIGLAASVSFDRLSPALGLTIGTTVLMFFLYVLATFWPAAEWLQRYSLFYYLKPKPILTGLPTTTDTVVLIVVAALAIAWAVVVFPRRDLAAPS